MDDVDTLRNAQKQEAKQRCKGNLCSTMQRRSRRLEATYRKTIKRRTMEKEKTGSKHNGKWTKKRGETIDAKLQELVDSSQGEEWTLQEIANECGTSKACIQQIEMKAIKNFRFKFKSIYAELTA
ncbi:MAG: hypothetical protein CMF45_08640 [Legionellales bacterium]|nr:hypothetical protein [Legionellales bacterium]|tara:strand:+ start:1003 stop:1377 length:375 start_codon:yes stop_codon:yes gene_type:complete